MDRRIILGNTFENQIEPANNPINNPIQEITQLENELMISGLKDHNIMSVSTPEQRTGPNNRSMNMMFANNTPNQGKQPFKMVQVTPEIPEPEDIILDRRIGYQYPKGNYKINASDKTLNRSEPLLPDNKKFMISKSFDVVDTMGKRAQNYEDFVSHRK